MMSNNDLPPEGNYLPPPDDAYGHGDALVRRESDYGLPQPWQPQAERADDDDVIDLRDLWRMVMAYKWLLLSMAVAGLLAALLASFVRTPTYQAATTLQIDKRAAAVVNFGPNVDAPVELDDSTGMGTQLELLKSRVLAERVIDELHLDRVGLRSARADGAGLLPGAGLATADHASADSPDAEAPSLFDRIRENWEKIREPTLDSAEKLDRAKLVTVFRNTIHTEQVRNSRMIKLSADNRDPRLAARIANTMATSFIALNLERRVEASSYAKMFLDEQLKLTQAKLEESERKLNEYARARNILTLRDESNPLDRTYTDYASALAGAEQSRIKAQSEYDSIKNAPNTAAQVLSNVTIQEYKAQRAKLDAEYQQQSKIYKDSYPSMRQLKAQMQDLDGKIRAEIAGILRSVRNQLTAAQQQEAKIRGRVNEMRTALQTGQDDYVDYNLLKREVDTNRELYDGLLQQVKEVGVAGGVETNNVQVVDRAEVPLFPYKPKIPLNAAIGLLAGLMLGLIMVFLKESLDDSVRSAEDVDAKLMLPLLGIIPRVKSRAKSGSLFSTILLDPRGHLAEAYRSLRTALQFSSGSGAPRTMLVTSTTKGEGKTTTAMALAINFAQLGGKVALIDADMRSPLLHTALGLSNVHGLSNYLSGQDDGGSLMHKIDVPNLAVITAGPASPNPVELLAGARLKRLLEALQKAGYEYIIVDAPPVLGLADALVLGNQLKNVLYVVQANATRISHVKSALQRLRQAGIVPRGVVLTQTLAKNTSYYADESYYGYGSNTPIDPQTGAALQPA